MVEIRVQFLCTLSAAIWYSSLSLLYLPTLSFFFFFFQFYILFSGNDILFSQRRGMPTLSFHPSSVCPSPYLIPSLSFLYFLYYESQMQVSRLSFVYKLLFYFYEEKYQHRTMPKNKQTNPAVHPVYGIEHNSLILHACLRLLEGLINIDCIAKPYLNSQFGVHFTFLPVGIVLYSKL